MNNLVTKIILLSSIFLINVIFFDFFLINIESLNFISNSIFSPDAWLNHLNANKIVNSTSFNEFLNNIKNYYTNFYNVYPILLSLIYLISSDIHFIILLNSIVLTATIFKLNNLIKLTLDNTYFFLPVLIVIFNPVIILSIIQPLKEIIIVYLSISLIHEFIKIKDLKKIKLSSLSVLFLIFFTLFLFRFYQPFLLVLPLILILFFSKIFVKLNSNKKFLLSILFIIFLIGLFIISGLFDQLYSIINNLRISLLYQNFLNESNFLSVNLNTYNEIFSFFLDFPKFFVLSIFEPIFFLEYKSDNLLISFYLVFNFILSVLIFGNIFFIYKTNINYLLIIITSIICILFLSYLITNLGTLVRIKGSFMIIISSLGMCGWLDLIFSKIIKLKGPLVLKIKSINKNLSLLILISIIVLLLLILRDLYVIKEVEFNNTSDLFYFITFTITVLAYVLTNPLYEIFFKDINDEYYTSIKNTLIDTFIISIISISLLLILFLIVFNPNFILQDSNYILMLSLINLPLASFIILGNVLISSKLDPLLTNIGNLIVPIFCILLILFLDFHIFFEIIVGLIFGQFLNFFYNFYLIFINKKARNILNKILKIKYYFSLKIFLKRNKNIILINFLCFTPILISNIYFSNQSYSYLTYWIITSKIIFTFFFFIIGMININFLTTFGIIYNYTNNKDFLIYKKISVLIFNLLILISVLVSFSFKVLIEPIIFDKNLLIIFNNLLLLFLIMPFFIHSFIYIKFNTLINKPFNQYIVLFLIFIVIFNFFTLSLNLEVKYYIYILFFNYFLIFIFINFYENKSIISDYLWVFFNFLLISAIFFTDFKNLYLVLLINLFFIFNYNFKKISY